MSDRETYEEWAAKEPIFTLEQLDRAVATERSKCLGIVKDFMGDTNDDAPVYVTLNTIARAIEAQA